MCITLECNTRFLIICSFILHKKKKNYINHFTQFFFISIQCSNALTKLDTLKIIINNDSFSNFFAMQNKKKTKTKNVSIINSKIIIFFIL